MLHDQMFVLYKGFRRDAHPMAVMCPSSGAMAAFYPESSDVADPAQRQVSLFACWPRCRPCGLSYKYNKGDPFVYPQNRLGYTENFRTCCTAIPARATNRPGVSRALDRIFILHADHEQNASTSTVRMAGSSYATPSPAHRRPARPASGVPCTAAQTRRF